MHVAEQTLRIGTALRYSEPKQPPCLGKVYRPAFADAVHEAEIILRIVVALCCSEPKQPPRLGKVYRPAFALVVHAAEHALRIGVALLCGKHKLLPSDPAILRRIDHLMMSVQPRASANQPQPCRGASSGEGGGR